MMQCLGLRPLAAVAISLHLAGCVLSIDAVVPESEAIFDEALLGTWEVENGPDRVTITRASESTYAVDFADDEVSGRFEARLGELDGQRVLDVWPAPSDTDPLEPYINLLVPGHVLFVLDVGGEEIRTQLMEPDTLLARITDGAVQLNYLISGEDQLVLVDASEHLRPALADYLQRRGIFGVPDVWHRVQGDSGNR